MKYPLLYRKSWTFDDKSAGWYTPNSIVLDDIVPEWRLPGGGVSKDQLTSYGLALDQAIAYTENHIDKAMRHLKKLKKAKEEWGKP